MLIKYIGIACRNGMHTSNPFIQCYEILASSDIKAEELLKKKHPSFRDFMIIKHPDGKEMLLEE